MPLFPAAEREVGLRLPTGALPPDLLPKDDGTVLGAAFRQYNTITSLYNYKQARVGLADEPGHEPLDIIRGTKYEQNYLENFVKSRSSTETKLIMAEIDQEEADRARLDKSGWAGTVAAMGAGIADPTIFIPVGAGAKSIRAGYMALRTGGRVAAASAVTAGIQESVLQATQQTRTGEESAMTIGAATVLGGLLGAGAGALLGRAERRALEKMLERDRVDMGNEIAGQPASLSAAAPDTRELELRPFGLDKIPMLGKAFDATGPFKRIVTGPTFRTFQKPFESARRDMADLAETPLQFKGNVEGIATTQGPALDRQARMMIDGAKFKLADNLDRLYAKYRFGTEPESYLGRQIAKIKGTSPMLAANPLNRMTPGQFRAEVGRAYRLGDTSDIPEVREAAEIFRREISNPLRDRAINANIFDEDVNVEKTAQSHFTRVYNKEIMTAKRPEVQRDWADWLASEQATKSQSKVRISGLTDELDKLEKRLIEEGLGTDDVIAVTLRRDELMERLQDEVEAWRGKSSLEAISAIKRKRAAKAGKEKLDSKRVKIADKQITDAVRAILKTDQTLTQSELHARAGEIIDRILGNPDGRLPYDAGNGGPRIGYTGEEPAPRGSLAHRDFMISDERLEAMGLLENDIGDVLHRMLETMVPDILLVEKFGDVDMTQAFKRLRENHERLSLAAKTEAERTKLKNQYDEAVGDMAGVRDRIRGVYGWTGDYGARNAARLAQAVKSYDFLTNMGGVALSSLPDLAGTVVRHGLQSTMTNGWRPFLKSISKMDGEASAWKAARKQFQALGIAAETMLATRVHAWQEVNAAYRPRSKFERGVHSASEGFAVASGLTLWTDVVKTIAGMVAQTEALKAITASAAGKATKKQITRLAEAGIDADMAERIFKHYNTAEGGKIIDGVPFANSASWTDQGAREAFDGALARDMDIAVITPGQEKPLWLSKPVASVIGQYKSFIAASTERLMLAGLQQHDFQVLQGLLFSVALGMVSAKAYSIVADTPAPERPQDWVKEGIHRSGVLGWFEEGNAIASKMTSGRADIFRVIGADKPLSRFQSRSILGALLGPTAGKIESLSAIGGSVARADWSESDTRRLRRLFAFQNLFYIRRIIDQAEKGFNRALDIPEASTGKQSYNQPTARPSTQVAAKGGEVQQIMAALKAPRKLQTDMAGKPTGIAAPELPQQANDPRLQELLDALRKPKKFTTDADGNVTGVSIV